MAEALTFHESESERDGLIVYRCWCKVDGETVGSVSVSVGPGGAIGHDTFYHGPDPAGALLLWRRARAWCRRNGIPRVLVHFEHDDDPMKEFWVKRGFTKVCEVFQGDVN